MWLEKHRQTCYTFKIIQQHGPNQKKHWLIVAKLQPPTSSYCQQRAPHQTGTCSKHVHAQSRMWVSGKLLGVSLKARKTINLNLEAWKIVTPKMLTKLEERFVCKLRRQAVWGPWKMETSVASVYSGRRSRLSGTASLCVSVIEHVQSNKSHGFSK